MVNNIRKHLPWRAPLHSRKELANNIARVELIRRADRRGTFTLRVHFKHPYIVPSACPMAIGIRCPGAHFLAFVDLTLTRTPGVYYWLTTSPSFGAVVVK